MDSISLDETQAVAPLRLLSYDIECVGRPGEFPHPYHDSVCQIGAMLQYVGETLPFVSVVFTLNKSADLDGLDLREFEDETALLIAWKDFLDLTDPDIMTGFNSHKFDLPYLVNRAERLEIRGFGHMGRLRLDESFCVPTEIPSLARGSVESCSTNITGRLQIDVFAAFHRLHVCPSYSLNALSMRYLHDRKADVEIDSVARYIDGTPEEVGRLAQYCLKDVDLNRRLLYVLLSLKVEEMGSHDMAIVSAMRHILTQ